MAKHNCHYCQIVINTCRIKCSVCPDFDLCLQCFACGAEAGVHKKEHDYQVLEAGDFHVFHTEQPWSDEEEESLLDAVEQYGFGNWQDTANHVKTRTVEECKDHYYTFFMHGSIGKATFPTEPVMVKITDHTCPVGGPLSPSLTTPLQPLELTLQEQHDLGYMPLRDDFEREYDNDAETLVSGLSINYDDEDLDIAFKLAQIDIYRHRLKERERRKRLARDHGLIKNAPALGLGQKQKSQKDSKKKSSNDDRDIHERLRVFAQFHSPKEHEQINDSLRKEKQIRTRVRELSRYRRNGITKIEECMEYETEKLRREKKKENRKKMGSGALAKRTSMVSKKAEERLSDNGEAGDGIGIGGDKKKKNGVLRSRNSLPGFDLLSERERKLCSSIGMKPGSYITIKTCIIKDYLNRKQGLPAKIRFPSHLDKTHRRKIMGFLSENGWIGSVGAY